MAEEEQQQDFSKLSLEDRCQHKNWKARVSAYDELTKLFQRIDDDKEWGKYAGWVRKFPADSNAAAQEKALEVTLLFLENAVVNQAGRIVAEVMAGVVGKCVTAPKARSKELALNIALMCVEVEKFEAVQEELMKGMELKNPKAVASCINILTEILKSFGPKVINLKTICKKVPVLSEDRDKTIREEAKKLMVELYRWLGPAFKPQLSAVKPLVVSEVEAEVEKCTDKPRQTRWLRSQQAREERVAVDGGDDGAAVEEDGGDEEINPDIDPFDLLDPVDILAKLPKDFYEKCEAKKWQERKEAMEALDALLVANPKLEAGDYADLVRLLKKMVGKDTNVVVVALAVKCIGGLANGLKKKFSPYASSCVSTILEKFKEKKANVVTAMREAIDACFVATSLESIQEDVVLALQNKNPSVKLETNAFLARSFAKTSYKIMSDKKLMKPYFTAILANLNESDPSVREAAAEAFGVALKHLGEKTLGPLIVDMEPIKLQKVKEFAEKAVITAPKEKGVKPSAVKSATSTATVKSNTSIKPASQGIKKPVAVPKKIPAVGSNDDLSEKPKPSATTQKPAGAKTAPTKQGAKVAVVAPKAATSSSKVAAEEPLGSNLPVNNLKSQRISDEMKLRILKWSFPSPRDEFIDLLKELMTAAGIGPTLMVNMFNSNFKLHLKALDTLQEEFALNPEGTKSNLDLILKWTTLRFFDTNPSVLIRILEYLTNVFQLLSDERQGGYCMADVEANAFFPFLVNKLGDSKENIRSSVHTIFRLLANIYAPTKIFGFLLDGLKSKNARQRTDCLDECSFMISTHGSFVMGNQANVTLKEIAKQISDRDTNVRNAALNAIVQAWYIQGDKVKSLIGNLADKDQSLLDERIKRASKTRPPVKSSLPKPHFIVPLTATTARVLAVCDFNNTPPEDKNDTESPEEGNSPVLQPVSSGVLQLKNMNATVNMDSSPNEDFINRLIPAYGGDISARTSALPEKYRIDFEAIDNMFSDSEPIPPLELLDTNIEQFVQGEQIALPQRRTVTKVPITVSRQTEALQVSNQSHQSIDLVVSQIGDTALRRSIESCNKLEKLLSDPETSSIMSGRVDTMLAMISLQMRRQQASLLTQDKVHLAELNKFFRSAVSLLTVLFKNEFLPKKASKEHLREIIYQLLVLIIDESLEHIEEAVSIIRLVNVMVVRVIENSEPNAISCALIRLLNDTLTMSSGENTRLLELVMKCQWKLLKQHNVWVQNKDYDWDVKGILTEYHWFMKNHPFASFHNRDGTPLKTIKTIVHALVMQAGCQTVQYHMNSMPELRDSEGGLYISKIIQRELLKK